MKADIEDLWVQALLSGDYEQGKDRLVDTDENWCCLGVLCDLAVESGAVPGLIRYKDHFKTSPNDRHDNMPPPSVYEWAGLDEGEAMFLSDLNDQGTPFSAIATVIRRMIP